MSRLYQSARLEQLGIGGGSSGQVSVKCRKGFTLIELLVVIAVSVFLVTTLITFNRSSGKNIIIFNEQARIIDTLTTAKAFSIQTFIEKGPLAGDFKSCAYGVHFEGDRYFVFRDTPLPDPISSPCIDGNNQYAGDKKFSGDPFEMIIYVEDPERFMFRLDDKVEFGNLPGGDQGFDVVFVPPDPKAYFFPESLDEAIIEIKLKDGSHRLGVKITDSGRITTE
jgi:prepilin-type N-terminal cleavage/methylation domain-containing protein